ncbi:hypothetical protein Plhal304r1_c066g0154351 [Plasmopara halstedii]
MKFSTPHVTFVCSDDSRSALDLRKVPLSPIHPDIANDTYIHRFQSQVSSLCL